MKRWIRGRSLEASHLQRRGPLEKGGTNKKLEGRNDHSHVHTEPCFLSEAAASRVKDDRKPFSRVGDSSGRRRFSLAIGPVPGVNRAFRNLPNADRQAGEQIPEREVIPTGARYIWPRFFRGRIESDRVGSGSTPPGSPSRRSPAGSGVPSPPARFRRHACVARVRIVDRGRNQDPPRRGRMPILPRVPGVRRRRP